jgi:hypothetical protein
MATSIVGIVGSLISKPKINTNLTNNGSSKPYEFTVAMKMGTKESTVWHNIMVNVGTDKMAELVDSMDKGDVISFSDLRINHVSLKEGSASIYYRAAGFTLINKSGGAVETNSRPATAAPKPTTVPQPKDDDAEEFDPFA